MGRKAPSQQRSRQMVELILDGAARVLADRGYSQMTTNLVAEVAGVSVGSLYQYFANKDALLQALYERHSKQMQHVATSVLTDASSRTLRQSIGAFTRALLAGHLVDIDLHRALERYFPFAAAPPPETSGNADVRRQVHELLERHRDEISHVDLEFATWFTICTVHALVHEAVLESPQYCSLGRLEPAITNAVVGFLTSDSSGSRVPARPHSISPRGHSRSRS